MAKSSTCKKCGTQAQSRQVSKQVYSYSSGKKIFFGENGLELLLNVSFKLSKESDIQLNLKPNPDIFKYKPHFDIYFQQKTWQGVNKLPLLLLFTNQLLIHSLSVIFCLPVFVVYSTISYCFHVLICCLLNLTFIYFSFLSCSSHVCALTWYLLGNTNYRHSQKGKEK